MVHANQNENLKPKINGSSELLLIGIEDSIKPTFKDSRFRI